MNIRNAFATGCANVAACLSCFVFASALAACGNNVPAHPPPESDAGDAGTF